MNDSLNKLKKNMIPHRAKTFLSFFNWNKPLYQTPVPLSLLKINMSHGLVFIHF